MTFFLACTSQSSIDGTLVMLLIVVGSV
ncbi:MAG TPA: hypothetical protein DD706_21690 [Nitrospiraceae bacterium]|nr:hypothetical protein [Nitrospiraceae bacterium]